MKEKIQMTTPLVEMDGDEMTRILWKIKSLLTVFILMFVFGNLMSCSDDNDVERTSIQKEIVGKWKLVEWAGVDLDLDNLYTYYEFKNDYTIEFSETTDRGEYHFAGFYSFLGDWSQADGKLEGYLSIKGPNIEGELIYHCWLQKDTMTLADKESELYEDGIPFLSPFRIFKRTK